MRYINESIKMLSKGLAVVAVCFVFCSYCFNAYYDQHISDRISVLLGWVDTLNLDLMDDADGCFTATKDLVDISLRISSESGVLASYADFGLQYELAVPFSDIGVVNSYEEDSVNLHEIQLQSASTHTWLQSVLGQKDCSDAPMSLPDDLAPATGA